MKAPSKHADNISAEITPAVMTDALPRKAKRTGAAERKRRYRARQARGEVILPVPVSFADIEALLDGGLVPEAQSEDRKTLAAAAARIVHAYSLASAALKKNRDAYPHNPLDLWENLARDANKVALENARNIANIGRLARR